jgi:hypothetical protein
VVLGSDESVQLGFKDCVYDRLNVMPKGGSDTGRNDDVVVAPRTATPRVDWIGIVTHAPVFGEANGAGFLCIACIHNIYWLCVDLKQYAYTQKAH